MYGKAKGQAAEVVAGSVTHNASNAKEVVWDDRVEVPVEEVELDKKILEGYRAEGQRPGKKVVPAVKAKVVEEPVGAEMQAGIEAVQAWAKQRQSRVSEEEMGL